MTELLDDVDEEFLQAMQLATEKAETYRTPPKSASIDDNQVIELSDDEDLLQVMQEATAKAECYRTPPPSAVKTHENLVAEPTDDDLRAMQLATEKAEFDHSRQSTIAFGNPEPPDDEDFLLAVRLSFEDAEINSPKSKQPPATPQNCDFNMSDDEDSLLAMQLEEVEFRHSPKPAAVRNKRWNDHASIQNDYKYALQLSKELNTYAKSASSSLADKSSTSELRTMDCVDFDLDLRILDENDVDDDYLLALKLSEADSPSKKKTKSPQKPGNVIQYLNKSMSVVDPTWELIDPNPDIYALFVAFNKRFFWGRLDMVEVQWSPRMTSCAGICTYHSRAGHCTVRLSVPLLKLRPRKDLIETLLHEMIHAYLFVTKNNRDRDGHGPQFHAHMYRINKESGANITVYHSFHDEVKLYKTHWWKCDGPCQHRAPYFGLVKRSMNRAPGPNDIWWNDHRATCNGQFHKIREPENYRQKKSKEKTVEVEKKNVESGIQNFFKTPAPENQTSVSGAVSGVVSPPYSHTSISKPSSVTPAPSNKKIFTLSDLAKNATKRSPTKSPKKFVPLPGQRNIIQFVNKS